MYHDFITSPLPLNLSPTCFSRSYFFMPLLFLSLSQLVLHTLSLSLSQSQGHATQIDCSLIANVMMLQSTHLTCLINTTAATPALFSLSCSHTHPQLSAQTCAQLQKAMLRGSYHVLFFYSYSQLSPPQIQMMNCQISSQIH